MNENDRVLFEAAVKKEGAEHRSVTDIEWEQRRLCSDESCIGVIGPDGRCKVCGKPFEGAQVAEGEPAEKAATEPQAMSADAAETFSDADEPEETAEADIDWGKRILCSDENCIGVIGPDGRCKECGKPYKGE
jgi:hypothetical protein